MAWQQPSSHASCCYGHPIFQTLATKHAVQQANKTKQSKKNEWMIERQSKTRMLLTGPNRSAVHRRRKILLLSQKNSRHPVFIPQIESAVF
ncbi:hypothetical protein CEXT_105691 [Caerostris extrusa]|uniref:Uncharacterized protein n=1 Tax=Caerostris extrusa TaxID=172846 RepID=A0AAV4MBQ0_CAEEX|nr:hypothetical protein CEXT_105691 [Caerostris extrusa]